MKKSLFIIGLSLASILALTGCNQNANETAAIDKLSHQLNRVTNTVAALANGNENQVKTNLISKYSNNSSLFSKFSDAYQDLSATNEQIKTLKTDILKKVKTIKKQIVDGVKLGNSNTNAIIELTDSMQKNNNNLHKTRSEFNSILKNISKINSQPDETTVDAKITKLTCCLNARECYLKNIYHALENIENILGNLENDEQNVQDYQTYDYQAPEPTNYEEHQPSLQQPQNNLSNVNFTNIPAYPNGYNGYNMPYNYGYNGAYPNAYPNGFNKFNPNRNTDTYGPGITNIDTYHNTNQAPFAGRHFGGSNGINSVQVESENQPEQQNEQNEEVKFEDNSTKNENQEQEKQHSESSTTQKIKFESENAQPQTIHPKRPPIPAETKQEDEQLKIKTVSTQEAEQANDEEGEDKVKGHTQTVNCITLDINKKIEKLIKG